MFAPLKSSRDTCGVRQGPCACMCAHLHAHACVSVCLCAHVCARTCVYVHVRSLTLPSNAAVGPSVTRSVLLGTSPVSLHLGFLIPQDEHNSGARPGGWQSLARTRPLPGK